MELGPSKLIVLNVLLVILPFIWSSSFGFPNECIHFPEDLCASQDSTCLCKSNPIPKSADNADSLPKVVQNLQKSSHSILCCHLNDVNQLKRGILCASSENDQNITALHIRNSTLGNITLGHALDPLLSLVSLAITDGVTTSIVGRFADVTPNVSCLNLSSNGMGDLQDDALADLFGLRALDLSANNVIGLPKLPPVTDGHTIRIDVSGNKHLGCSSLIEAMSPLHMTSSRNSPLGSSPSDLLSSSTHPSDHILFHNKDNTSCISPMGFGWFNSTQQTSLEELEYKMKFRKECLVGDGVVCRCELVRYNHIPGKSLSLSIAVDCSGLALTSLPLNLPNHTTILNVSNNNISSLEPLGKDDIYNEIMEFYADNNLISSIEVLEGSVFLENFQALSLSGNKLKELPTYFLKSIFQKRVFRNMRLGKNEYNCDCNTYHSLRPWVEENKKHILDHDKMFCASREPKVIIVDLKQEEVCLHKTDWMDYLPIVVVAEILLLIALIAKVSYDYWIFKTKGYLPWPASRTPKLPCCDWAFDL